MSMVIAIAAEKGGVGKTTTTINLAYGLAQAGLSVGVIDLDGQGQATKYLGVEDDTGDQLVGALVESGNAIEWVETSWGVKLAPGGRALNTLQLKLAGVLAREGRLKRALARTTDNPDLILLDCPPGLGVAVINALVAADALLVPVQTEDASLEGLEEILSSLEETRELGLSKCHLLGVIPTLVDDRTNISREILELLESQLGEEYLSPRIRRSVSVSESYGQRTPIAVYDPKGIGASDHAAAVTWLQGRIS